MKTLKELPIFDGHNDFSEKLDAADLTATPDFFFARTDVGHIDYPRAVSGGLSGGLFSIFVDPPAPTSAEDKVHFKRPDTRPLSHEHALAVTDRRIHLLDDLIARGRPFLSLARTTGEIEASVEAEKLAIVLHLEGAEAVHPSLSNLDALYERGVRSIGPVWSRENAFGFGVPFTFPLSPDCGPGLKAPGKELVRACDRMGIMVDLAHMTEKAFWDVAEISTKPLVASHSCVYAISPSPRNLTDKQLSAIKETNGLVGVNYSVLFVRPDGGRDTETPLRLIADHFVYIADRFGIDHVGMGSDFDGTRIPKALGDVSGLPKLLAELRSRGFNADDLEKITYKNWMRVLSIAWNEKSSS